MNCPLCRAAMKSVSYEGCPVCTCESCGGEFVTGESLAEIVRLRVEKFPESLVAQVRSQTPQFGVFCEARALPCPNCRRAMHTLTYSGDSGVCIDRCGSCGGVWLDHDELEKIQAIMERWQDQAPSQIRAVAGRLEHARAQAAARASKAYSASRFSFVNAVINRLLDAA